MQLWVWLRFRVTISRKAHTIEKSKHKKKMEA
jgi:hypothetical protein